jgi:hypothetical protein
MSRYHVFRHPRFKTPGPPFPYCPADRDRKTRKPPARAGLDTARAGPKTAQA